MRKTTGTQIRGEIKLITAKLASLQGQFPNSLSYFEGDAVPNPVKVAESILVAEREMGVWQAAQKELNVSVRITFEDQSITLQEAINIVGGYSRVAKLWKDASGAKKKDRYDYAIAARRTARSTSEVEAKHSITNEEALQQYIIVERAATELRTRIGIANNIEVEVQALSAS